MPSGPEVLEGPGTGLALRDRDIAGLDGADDAAAVEDGVGRLVRVGVAGGDVALQVVDLVP